MMMSMSPQLWKIHCGNPVTDTVTLVRASPLNCMIILRYSMLAICLYMNKLVHIPTCL